MTAPRMKHRNLLILFVLAFFVAPAHAEYDASSEDRQAVQDNPPPKGRRSNNVNKRRKYFIEDTSRVDAGSFHVGFMAGGNFYIEPKFDNSGSPLGDNFEDFGFQAGVVMDYDYDDTPLGLRGFIGYSYILNSVHKFTVDFTARMLLQMSDSANFGIGIGIRSSFWYRFNTNQTLGEEFLFVPFWIFEAGFDFNPFMVDFKFPIHRIGTNSTILGLELYFGVRI